VNPSLLPWPVRPQETSGVYTLVHQFSVATYGWPPVDLQAAAIFFRIYGNLRAGEKIYRRADVWGKIYGLRVKRPFSAKIYGWSHLQAQEMKNIQTLVCDLAVFVVNIRVLGMMVKFSCR
jgi:hypothetical protein